MIQNQWHYGHLQDRFHLVGDCGNCLKENKGMHWSNSNKNRANHTINKISTEA